MMYLQLLFLILVANGTPVLAHVVFRNYWTYPLDFGWRFFDGHPCLGQSKTIRGVVLSLLITMVCALLIGVSARIGLVVSGAAMLGDSLASFTKRRLGLKSESQAFGLDQVPESLFPLLALQSTYHLEFWGILITVIAFVILELVLSRVLFYFKLRKHPY
jgi:CDP-2,3-bis-(O-geranylgeranyl)-sn-glycerol synthase